MVMAMLVLVILVMAVTMLLIALMLNVDYEESIIAGIDQDNQSGP